MTETTTVAPSLSAREWIRADFDRTHIDLCVVWATFVRGLVYLSGRIGLADMRGDRGLCQPGNVVLRRASGRILLAPKIRCE